MKRNWFAIGTIIILIIAYEFFVLGPYNRKFQKSSQAAQATSAPSDLTTSARLGAVSSSGGQESLPASREPRPTARPSENQKKAAETIDLGDGRSIRVFPSGAIGDVSFSKYFQRGKEVLVPIRIVENGFYWSSSDARLDACLRDLRKDAPLSFRGEASGVRCRLTFDPQGFIVGTKLLVESHVELKGDLSFQTEDGLGEGPQFDHRHLTFKRTGEGASRVRDAKLWEEASRRSGPYDFISWGDKYFAANLLPKGRFNPDLFHNKGSEEGLISWGISYPLRWTPGQESLSYEFDLYFSLKDFQELRAVRSDLADTVDFGFFGALARIMLWCLEKLNRWVGNYGIAIIILSLIIRLLLWPVNRKMFESGQKMKDIQPQMELIKKKYEGKRDQLMQMNQEIRQLYAKAGVNPLGACLPVLLQIPIFFSLNSVLSNSVDLYQAPFFGWIQDLSFKDPYYVLPVVWTLTLILSVELNPQPQSQPGMPDMKWISRVMFLVFGFISKDFPSGLNLYFLVSNVAGILQQWLFKRRALGGQQILVGKER